MNGFHYCDVSVNLTGGEESRFFEGDIRLLPEEDPYNSRKRSYKSKRMTEDKIMTSSGDDSLGPTAEKTWPGGIVPYMFEQTLCKSMG